MSHFRAIIGTITPRVPLHVGTGEATETADGLLRRDVQGRLLIPGTALAGVLRSIATRLGPRLGAKVCMALEVSPGERSDETQPRRQSEDTQQPCNCLVCRLFGDWNPQDLPRNRGEPEEKWLTPTGRASRLIVYDAALDESPASLIRDGVGIDRTTGAAARRERAKFSLEVLPAAPPAAVEADGAGAEYNEAKPTFKLRIEIKPGANEAEDEAQLQLLAAALAEWKAEHGAIGGRVSRGLGAFTLSKVQFVERELDRATTLLEFLKDGPPWQATGGDYGWVDRQTTAARARVQPLDREKHKQSKAFVARTWALAEFTLTATGPFLTHDLVQAARGGFDHAPLLTAYFNSHRPILPGSSLRGVLRSQAERIARTLATHAASQTANAREDFLIHCPACHPLTTKTNDPVASCNSFIKKLDKVERDRIEREGAGDKMCLACQLFGNTWQGSRLRVEDAPLREGTTAEFKVLDFLAIDRFTGGGRDSAKFDAVVLWQPEFSVRLVLENPEAWELGWLALTLRDLHDGLATVGFGRSKGFGRCKIKEGKLTLGYLRDEDFPLPEEKMGADEARQKAGKAARNAGQRLRAGRPENEYSGLYRVVTYDESKHDDWLVLADGWVAAFNQQVAIHERDNDFILENDSYFGGVDHLYPVKPEVNA
ncbi:MAG TPA: hypothetical protein DEP84_26520 [Chloroflexi bacterium]|nr:hypothetical protein [Chloroflexota bacterium]